MAEDPRLSTVTDALVDWFRAIERNKKGPDHAQVHDSHGFAVSYSGEIDIDELAKHVVKALDIRTATHSHQLYKPRNRVTQIKIKSEHLLVHILSGGFAICGREGIPQHWDSNERWVSKMCDEVNCPACRIAWERRESKRLSTSATKAGKRGESH